MSGGEGRAKRRESHGGEGEGGERDKNKRESRGGAGVYKAFAGPRCLPDAGQAGSREHQQQVA